MGELSERLAAHRAIGLDTPIFIYHVEANPRYRALASEVLDAVEVGRWTAVTSMVTLTELTVRPWQQNRLDLVSAYEALLAYFPHLLRANVTRPVARQAAELRARYRLRPADALQVATAVVHRATALVTNDRGLTRVAPTLDVVLLDDFVEPQ